MFPVNAVVNELVPSLTVPKLPCFLQPACFPSLFFFYKPGWKLVFLVWELKIFGKPQIFSFSVGVELVLSGAGEEGVIFSPAQQYFSTEGRHA